MEITLLALGVLVAAVAFGNLAGRIRVLEQKLDELYAHGNPRGRDVRQEPLPTDDKTNSNNEAPPRESRVYVSNESDVLQQFGAWLVEDWLVKLGAVLLLLGFGWLASYAFIHGWIGPAGRIVLGLVLGTSLMGVGFWRMQRFAAQGSIFLVLGSTVVLMTTYAARTLYGFFTPSSSLGLMFLSSTCVALASIVFNRKALGVASVGLAGVAPLLTNSPTSDYIGLFTYLAVVVVGAVLLASIKNHREVSLTALIVVTLYSVTILMGAPVPERDTLLLFAGGFTLLFYVASTAGLLRLVGNDAFPDLLLAVGNALFFAAWIHIAAPAVLQSLMYAAAATLFAVGAFVTSRMTQRFESFYVYAAIGVGYIAAATAAELSGPTLTIAFTIEAGIVALLTFLLTHNVHFAHRAAFLLAGPTLLALFSVFSSSWGSGYVLIADFFVLLTISVVYLLLGIALYEAAHKTRNDITRRDNAILFIMGSLFAYALLWRSLHEILPDDAAVFFSLVVFTVIGISVYIVGIHRDSKGLWSYGGVLLAFVVGRLLLVEVWNMELTLRIVTFFAIGVLLMGTAFIGKKKLV